MPQLVAIIIGAGGQDGTLLAQRLRSQGLKLILISRDSLIDEDQTVTTFSIFDKESVVSLIKQKNPTFIYYLAAHHHSAEKYRVGETADDQYELSWSTHVYGLHNVLDAVAKGNKNIRVFYASSALIFDGAGSGIQTECTRPNPMCIYGLTKLEGQNLCKFYRDVYGVFVSVGILYSHESHLRKENYLSMKTLSYLLSLKNGVDGKLEIGDINAVNDWGYAPIYVKAFTMMLRASSPSTYIVSSGRGYKVSDFLRVAFEKFGLRYEDYIDLNPNLLGRAPRSRVGDATKIRKELGWEASYDLSSLIDKLLQDLISQIEVKKSLST